MIGDECQESRDGRAEASGRGAVMGEQWQDSSDVRVAAGEQRWRSSARSAKIREMNEGARAGEQ